MCTPVCAPRFVSAAVPPPDAPPLSLPFLWPLPPPHPPWPVLPPSELRGLCPPALSLPGAPGGSPPPGPLWGDPGSLIFICKGLRPHLCQPVAGGWVRGGGSLCGCGLKLPLPPTHTPKAPGARSALPAGDCQASRGVSQGCTRICLPWHSHFPVWFLCSSAGGWSWARRPGLSTHPQAVLLVSRGGRGRVTAGPPLWSRRLCPQSSVGQGGRRACSSWLGPEGPAPCFSALSRPAVYSEEKAAAAAGGCLGSCRGGGWDPRPLPFKTF